MAELVDHFGGDARRDVQRRRFFPACRREDWDPMRGARGLLGGRPPCE
jgi:hypothetical protein